MVANWAYKLVVSYVRSSGGGNDVGLSVSLQKTEIERCVAEAGGRVSDWYVDEGCSGRSMKRPSLQRLLAAARSGERAFDVVVVYSLSRLCRSFEDFSVLGSLLGGSCVEVFSVSEPRTESAMNRFAGSVIRAFQEYLREQHRESTRRGIAYARRMRKS